MKKLFFSCIYILLIFIQINAQYTTLNAHSHNDYANDIPFWSAYYSHFGSIEADVWAVNGELFVAHEQTGIVPEKTLDALYIQPIVNIFKKNGGQAWGDFNGSFQLLVDLKSSAGLTLDILSKKIARYPEVFDPVVNKNAVRIIVTGNCPTPGEFKNYPDFIFFDGRRNQQYTHDQLKRVPLFSEDLRLFTKWNGKGNIIDQEHKQLKQFIDSVHQLGSKIRFWDSPDMINAWKTFINLGVDYINTDHIYKLADYLDKRKMSEYIASEQHQLYVPTYQNDGADTRVKNIILCIGDGTGLAQLYAGFTANGGVLNIFSFRNIGFSKTWSDDEYITDSAAGGSALSTGKKTQNRHIGVDSLDHPNPNIPELISRWKISSGIVTTDEAVGATPAAFYAHEHERDFGEEIADDFLKSPVQLLVGGNPEPFVQRKDGRNIPDELKKQGFTIITDVSRLAELKEGKAIVLDNKISLSEEKGRGDLLPFAAKNAIRLLNQNKNGFFLMVEGAQVDFGGHANNMSYVVKEVLDFDKTVAEAIKFADQNGETLVIVTADHETGGLSLLDGNFKTGMIDGQFSSNDHSAIMVPVFAYGPRSSVFRGVYENTEVFKKIMDIFEQNNKN
jgi:alkaline phosphatase